MSKIILLDVDGVVIRPRHKYFSEKYSEEHNVSLEEILPFFKGDYKNAAKGEVSIKDVLPPYLDKWGWKNGLEEFLKYWFDGERTVDVNVVELVRLLRKKGIRVYLVSDNEEERAKYIMDKIGLKNEFDGAYFSYELKCTKENPEFFKKVLKDLRLSSGSVEYWDDDQKNTTVAESVGINAKVYTSFEEFEKRFLQL